MLGTVLMVAGGALVLLIAQIFFGMGGDLRGFIDIPSAAMVGGYVLGMAMIGLRMHGVRAVETLFSPTKASAADLSVLAIWGRFCARAAWEGGVLGLLVGAVLMLKGGVENVNAWSAGGAVALLTVLYAIPLATLFSGIARWAECERIRREEKNAS